MVNALERMELISRIGRELQARMTFTDIDTYLAGHDIDTRELTPNVNSKWVYVKEILKDEPIKTVIRIADELEVPHSLDVAPSADSIDSSFWLPGHFRLFLSHVSSFKKETKALQASLKIYGISGFVAHADIEPSREWMREIENALYTMDALAAVLTEGFSDSEWTDQEVGAAIGRGVPVIPIIRDVMPYGFLGKYQGLRVGRKRTVGEVAEAIFDILSQSERTRNKVLGSLIQTTLTASEFGTALDKIGVIREVDGIPQTHLERLREGVAASQVFASHGELRDEANELLRRAGLPPVSNDETLPATDVDDDLPF